MFYINSAINPILYNVMSSKFRDGFKRLFLVSNYAQIAKKYRTYYSIFCRAAAGVAAAAHTVPCT